MNTVRLRYFLTIAEEKSINRAATVLGIAQPALSRQVRMLEKALGVALFHRTRNGVRLTEDGEKLRTALTGPLRQVELALQNIGSPLAQIERDVVFGLPETTAGMLGALLISRMNSVFPNVRMRVVVHDPHRLVDAMLHSEVDIAVIHGPSPDERLFYTELVSEDLALVGGADSGLSPTVPKNFRDLADLPFVFPSARPGVRDIIKNAALRQQIDIKFRFEVDSLQISKNLIETGVAYGILPLSAFADEMRAGRLTYAPIQDPAIIQHLGLAVRPELNLPREFVVQFGRLVGDETVALIENGSWSATLSPDWRPVPHDRPGSRRW
ncbi:LysR family transcriptional regulator [Nocardia macrotermitis]|uniref:HTH-type transcriptional regulator GltC n=1 Tax=Nocardia macrotermitis TaxID=2585198 RepID=A0A7K0DEW0_9NOCA|nr:LysR family transcriptional regulator [Nocardia macrotermitis]MQY24330.1 HTH-type transcriptional regulator GltC [Nocardia macrotermitis]